MTIHFYIKYHTVVGEQIFVSGNIKELGNEDPLKAVLLEYKDDNFWKGSIVLDDISLFPDFTYYYSIRVNGENILEGEMDRKIYLTGTSGDISVIDTWNYTGDVRNSYFTKPFLEVLLPHQTISGKERVQLFSHEFRVKAPLLQRDESICIVGSNQTLGEWSTLAPIVLQKRNTWYTTSLIMEDDSLPFLYKYGLYNTREKIFLAFESGDNRSFEFPGESTGRVIIQDGFADFNRPLWKGAGIAIPVFSLKSKCSFGVGEFCDLHLLVDWAKKAGLSMIQILPINDTIATNSWQDSYPYSAISAFALHPIYVNLEKVAGKEHAKIVSALKRKQKSLNDLEHLDYEQVLKFKLLALREIFEVQKKSFLKDKAYASFFESSKNWLIPYAAFSVLRDKNKSAEFGKWKTNSVYSKESIEKFTSPAQKQYPEVLFYYFIQFHLDGQLRDATEYAHKNGIILKGDVPIGISRNSVDAWTFPQLFNMDEQAGAPPDDFAVKGQNWGFPTYNWTKMQEDGYAWWRTRFAQMSRYFDAFRIDHILGFFRIWSIPVSAQEGILGKFYPAVPVHISEFHSNRIFFDHQRYCQPFITDNILYEYFGDQVDFVKGNFLSYDAYSGQYTFLEQYNTQSKVEARMAEMADEGSYITQGLYNLLANVILFEEERSQGQQFHFRIAMNQTASFRALDDHTQQQLYELYVNYFFVRQDELWKKEAMKKLPGLKRSTNMLICGEDLGMVPACVSDVMKQLSILSLEIQRMPKDPASEFFYPKDAPYLSVVTPSTHDMSTIRGWWEEDRSKTQKFYNNVMEQGGEAPLFCEPWINREIVIQHLYSPAMWTIFQLQDLLGMSNNLRRQDPYAERVNDPANPKHYWRYRMHLTLESLIKEKTFNEEVRSLVISSGRGVNDVQ